MSALSGSLVERSEHRILGDLGFVVSSAERRHGGSSFFSDQA
jgi:hypothetical protein